MSSNIPSAPTATGAESKKSSGSTAIIITLIIVFAVIILPMIIGLIVVFNVFGFIEKHYDEWDINGIIHGISYLESDGAPLTHNESIAIRNIVSQVESVKDGAGTISRLDCLYLERIASYYTEQPTLCNNGFIYGEAVYQNKYDNDKVEYNNGTYKLYVNDGTTCAEYTLNGVLGSHNGYSVGKSLCDASKMVKLTIVDTGGELEPYNEYHLKLNDDDDEIKIDIKS